MEGMSGFFFGAQRFVDDGQQLIGVERLGHVVGCTVLDRLHGRVDRPVGRDQNHWKAGVALLAVRQQFHAANDGHFQVADNEVKGVVPQKRQRFRTIFGGGDLVPTPGQMRSQHHSDAGLVVDDEDSFGHSNGRIPSGAGR